MYLCFADWTGSKGVKNVLCQRRLILPKGSRMIKVHVSKEDPRDLLKKEFNGREIRVVESWGDPFTAQEEAQYSFSGIGFEKYLEEKQLMKKGEPRNLFIFISHKPKKTTNYTPFGVSTWNYSSYSSTSRKCQSSFGYI